MKQVQGMAQHDMPLAQGDASSMMPGSTRPLILMQAGVGAGRRGAERGTIVRAKKRISNNRGFTLVELVLVIILVAILAAIAVPRFVNLSRQADIAATRGALGAIRGGMIMDYASRTLVNRGVARFANVVYHSWFMELDVPINEIANTSSVANASGTVGGVVTGETGQTQTINMAGANVPNAAFLVSRNQTSGAAGAFCCDNPLGACVVDQSPNTGWVYESFGDYEGILKPCGDNSNDTGFADDTADVW